MIVPRVKLGDLCHVVTKGTTPTSIGFDFSEVGVPFLRIQNLNKTSVELEDVLYISEQTHKALSRSIIRPKDFLITIAGTIGKVAIVPEHFPECNCNQAIAILRFDYKKLNPQYLLHWLATSDALEQITGRKVTATISNLSLGQIKQLAIPLPPIVEQQKIAAILDASDSLRQKDQQLVERYTALSHSLFLEMFGDPVMNPMDWLRNTIGDNVKKIKTWNPAQSIGVSFLYIDLSTIDKDNKTILLQEVQELISPDAPSRARQLVKSTDILVSTVRPNLNGVAIVPNQLDGSTASTGYCVLRVCEEKLNSQYLFYWVQTKHFVNDMILNSSGANYPAISDKIIKQSEILIPPIALQNQFAESIKLIEAQKQQAQASFEKSEALFSSLLQRAFTGELTIKMAA